MTRGKSFLSVQQKWSQAFDRRCLPPFFRVDGNRDYLAEVVPRHLRPATVVCDIGGWKSPLVQQEVKSRLGLTVVGIDIDPAELARAPSGSYDQTVCADITDYAGDARADLVVCQAVLEHVADTEKALRSIASCLKSGGLALLFVPSRNAAYARLGMILPDAWKQWIIRKVMPGSAHLRGFKAYYDRCTPRQFRAMAGRCGFEVQEAKSYYISSYFSYFFPLHVLWRMWVGLFYLCNRENAAETFTMVLRKR